MSLILKHKMVGPWPMNVYVLICKKSMKSAVIDPGADADKILSLAEGTHITKILITHGHFDHVDALETLVEKTGADVMIHPTDAEKFELKYGSPLNDGKLIAIGEETVRAIHSPGHTPGMTCFDLGDDRIIVGDTVFVGGPGKTWSVEEFHTQMETMRNIVFAWPDETKFFPGHGPAGVIGEERPAYEAFANKGWDPGLFGDVAWDQAS